MRERLMVGALELFRDGGTQAISLRRLALNVGVSHTMLYRYFANKEELLTAIRMSSLEALEQTLLDADTGSSDVMLRIETATLALVKFGRERFREYRFIFAHEQPRLDKNHPLLALRHRVFNHIVVMAEEANAKGLIALDARTWVHIAWGLIHGMLVLDDSNQLIEGRQFDELMRPVLDTLLPKTV